MSSWDALEQALEDRAAAGGTADFWWRDDDAIERTDALGRLLGLRHALDVPLALAVIPATATKSLAEAVSGVAGIEILQHGYAHVSHRPAGAKKAELGADRDIWDVARDIAEGRGRMVDLFGDDGWLDVMVPPWNRIDPPVATLLPGLGFHGLTTFRTRNLEDASESLRLVNTHIDIIDWRKTRAFAGDEPLLGAAIEALESDTAAVGLLTHHLAHDEACWAFVERFVTTTQRHDAVRWRSAHDLFPAPA
jgi:hypothetical protein